MDTFLRTLYLVKYIAMVINVTVIDMYKLFYCCFKHSLYQHCHCIISPVILGRSFNHFEPRFFFLSNDRLDDCKIAKVSSGIVRSLPGSGDQERAFTH